MPSMRQPILPRKQKEMCKLRLRQNQQNQKIQLHKTTRTLINKPHKNPPTKKQITLLTLAYHLASTNKHKH